MKVTLRNGDFNRKIEIETPVTTQDSSGDPVVDWESLGTFWAAADPDRGREFYADNGIVAEQPMLFRVHYYPSITITKLCRVTYRGDIYNIDWVQDYKDARIETHIYGKTGVNQG